MIIVIKPVLESGIPTEHVPKKKNLNDDLSLFFL
jgi:hypothetical protein